MCPRLEQREGYPLSGDGYPGYAQGAYLSGDEPGAYCRDSDERVAPRGGGCPHEEKPQECPLYAKTRIVCPACLEDAGDKFFLYLRDKMDQYTCPECQGTFTADELMHSLSILAIDAMNRVELSQSDYEEFRGLREKLAQVRKVVAA